MFISTRPLWIALRKGLPDEAAPRGLGAVFLWAHISSYGRGEGCGWGGLALAKSHRWLLNGWLFWNHLTFVWRGRSCGQRVKVLPMTRKINLHGRLTSSKPPAEIRFLEKSLLCLFIYLLWLRICFCFGYFDSDTVQTWVRTWGEIVGQDVGFFSLFCSNFQFCCILCWVKIKVHPWCWQSI